MSSYIIWEKLYFRFERLHHKLPNLEAEKKRETTSPRKATAIASSSPLAQERVPLINNEGEEEIEQEEVESQAVLQAPESIPDEPMESGFYSETMLTMEEEEDEPEQRLPQEVINGLNKI